MCMSPFSLLNNLGVHRVSIRSEEHTSINAIVVERNPNRKGIDGEFLWRSYWPPTNYILITLVALLSPLKHYRFYEPKNPIRFV